MKKTIKIISISLPVILFLIIIGVYAITSSITSVSKEDFKTYDFDRYDLKCGYGAISVILENNRFVLAGTYNCLYADLGDNNKIEMFQQSLNLRYSGTDFFSCVREGTKDKVCFETYVKNNWDTEAINYQFILRRYLKQMQNSSNTILSKPLIRYYG